jgi:lipopolysaccharide export system permease protein
VLLREYKIAALGKLDWYILKKFIFTFLFCLLLFTVIAVAVDSSEKTDDFVKAGLSAGQVITEYYLGFVPYIWSLLFPLFVFIAVIFFTSKMAMRSEIIAILASGTGYNRFLRPYLLGGILFAGLLWLGSRYWIPKANELRAEFQSKHLDKNDPLKSRPELGCNTCFYKRVDSNTFVGFRNYDTITKSARGFFMEKVRNNRVVYNLRAETIKWDTAVKKWKLFNAAERHIDSSGERLIEKPALHISISLLPYELIKDDYIKDKLTTPELVRFIKREELRGTEGLNALKVEWYRRTATPATVLLLTMIGAVIASRRTRGGSGLHLALGIVIAAMFIISDRFSTVFATKGNFPPLLAAWLPNIVFTAVAYWIYRRTPK